MTPNKNPKPFSVSLKTSNLILTHFIPLSLYITPEIVKKTFGFLMF